MPKRRCTRERLDPATARIAIVGSSLAGLSTAISLLSRGFRRIDIYERDASLQARREGYGLTLTYHPTGILHTLGVLNEVADADCPSRSHYLFKSDGEILGYFGNAFKEAAGFGQRGNLRVPRQIVRQILIEKLSTMTTSTAVIHWNHRLVAMRKEGDDCVKLEFSANGASAVTMQADLVVAADGIRSTVLQTWLPNAPPPKSLGVRIILGLTENIQHPVVDERGFYTLSEGMRLFVMPYSGSRRSLDPNEPVQFMWQLSFIERDDVTIDIEQKDLQTEALERTQGWHEPVQTLIRATPAASIWGTLLQDQDPVALQEHLLTQHPNCQRVILAGDALHAMSPFKGQGANQALQDGVVIASWLSKASLSSAVTGCMREMVQRTAPVVAASRQAAKFWHSVEALQVNHKFAGVGDASKLLQLLRLRSVNAETENLDDAIRIVVAELGISNNKDDNEMRMARLVK